MADEVPSADELVRRAQAGDQDAVGQLVGMHRSYRQVIVRHHFEGLSTPQIAERLGRGVPSVQKAWSRAVVRLRRELKGTL